MACYCVYNCRGLLYPSLELAGLTCHTLAQGNLNCHDGVLRQLLLDIHLAHLLADLCRPRSRSCRRR